MTARPHRHRNCSNESTDALSVDLFNKRCIKTCGFIVCVVVLIRFMYVRVYEVSGWSGLRLCHNSNGFAFVLRRSRSRKSSGRNTSRCVFRSLFPFFTHLCLLLAHIYSTNRLEFGEVTVIRRPRGLDEYVIQYLQ